MITKSSPKFAYYYIKYICNDIDAISHIARKYNVKSSFLKKTFSNTGVDYIINISYGEQLRQAIKALLEIASFRFLKNKVAVVKSNNKMKFLRQLSDIINREMVLYNDTAIEKYNNRIYMSWELFSHLVYWCGINNRTIRNKLNKYYNIQNFLKEADNAANLSKCRKAQMGAVLVKNGKLKYSGRNGHPSKTRLDYVCERERVVSGTHFEQGLCNHAEASMIAKASSSDLENGIVYINAPPCIMCTKLLIQSDVKIVIFKESGYSLDGVKLAWRLNGHTKFLGVK